MWFLLVGFGCCFDTVQLLVWLSGSGLVLGFWCCSFGGGVCGCKNRSACVAHNPEVGSLNLPPLFFFARLRVVLRVFRHRVHCSVSGDLFSEILIKLDLHAEPVRHSPVLMRQSMDRLPLDDEFPGTYGVEEAQRSVDDLCAWRDIGLALRG